MRFCQFSCDPCIFSVGNFDDAVFIQIRQRKRNRILADVEILGQLFHRRQRFSGFVFSCNDGLNHRFSDQFRFGFPFVHGGFDSLVFFLKLSQ